MRCASSLRGFWAHSANDNPVADWALLRGVQGLRQFGSDLRQLTDKHLKRLRDLEAKGLNFTVLRSAEPQAVPLTFKSPYGYLVAAFTVDYDYFVRVIKTAVRKGLLTDQEGHDAIRAMTRRVRGWMEELARFETFLWKPQLIKLTRADYLPGADAEARKRVEAVTAIFGPVPADIFSGRIQPPYTKRRSQITDAERGLLERVGQELAAADAKPASSSDASEAKLL
jgi:integrating conjugative element protein (TIGR03761 family)